MSRVLKSKINNSVALPLKKHSLIFNIFGMLVFGYFSTISYMRGDLQSDQEFVMFVFRVGIFMFFINNFLHHFGRTVILDQEGVYFRKIFKGRHRSLMLKYPAIRSMTYDVEKTRLSVHSQEGETYDFKCTKFSAEFRFLDQYFNIIDIKGSSSST